MRGCTCLAHMCVDGTVTGPQFNSRMRGKGEMRRNALGLGFLVGAAGIVYGHERGCTKAEILAINDDPTQFRKLVRQGAACTHCRCVGRRPSRCPSS